MSRRLIGYIGIKSGAHPWLALGLVVLLTAVAAITASERLRLEMDVATLLPADSDVAQSTRLAEWDFGRQDYILGVLEVRSDAPPEIANDPASFLLSIHGEVEESLFDRTVFRRIGASFGEGQLQTEAQPTTVARLTDDELTRIENTFLPNRLDELVSRLSTRVGANPSTETLNALAFDPFGIEALLQAHGTIVSGPIRGEAVDGVFLSADGRMLLFVLWPLAPSTDLILSQALRRFLNETRNGLYERNPAWRDAVDISFMGQHIENAEGESDIRTDIVATSLVSFSAVLLLFFIAFRQPEGVLFVALPLAVGVVWTMGLASLFVDRITQVTLTFAAIMIGLSIDFSIHFYNRYVEVLRQSQSLDLAMKTALTQTGPLIVAGAITTGMAFFGMTLTQFEGFRQLGLFGGLGIIVCLLANAAALPALIVVFSRLIGPGRAPMATFGLKKVMFTVSAYPRMTVAAGLCMAVYLGFYGTRAQFNDDFRNLRQPSDSYTKLLERMENHFDLPGSPVIIVTESATFEEALATNDRLHLNLMNARALWDIVSVDSLRNVLPSEATQRQNLSRLAGLRIDAIRRDLVARVAATPNLPAGFFDPALARLESLVQESAAASRRPSPPITLEMTSDREFYSSLVRYMVRDPSGERLRVITRVYPRKDTMSDGVSDLFKEWVASGIETPVTILGNDVLSMEIQGVVTRDLSLVLIVVTVGIYLYLLFYFGRMIRALLALIPVLFALLCMLGMMHLLGIRFNYLNVIALPMIIGIGVDNSIHLLGRIYEGGRHALKLAVEKTGRAVVITSLTTIFGFGSLCIANFQGIREIGLLVIIGTVGLLFATLVFLPALVRLTDPRITYQGGSGDEIG
jgi:predicted RND superfamily exporter protein